ncbi:MAG: GNAT family N-acetyltransferase [Myxococcota bacterium]
MPTDSADSQSFSIRPVRAGDEIALFELIRELARFEHLEHRMTGSAEALRDHLFGPKPVAEALIAEVQQQPVGFALYFTTYSTFLTRPGLYLEDLFVLEQFRKFGIGKALISAVRDIALSRSCGRFEWSVLDWNENAIAFYERFGAKVLPDWRICRIEF